VNTNKAKANSEVHRFKWKLFFAGMVAIVIGYITLAMADTTFAPILLVLGYCVLIPLSFL
jgi:uncharacterized membrane protein HdeD (DUF308 family)